MMSLFNRLVTVFLLLSVIACALLSGVAVWVLQAPPARSSLVEWLTLLVDVMGRLSVAQRLTITVIMLLVMLVAFVLLVFELRPKPREVLIPVRTAEGGETVVASSAVERRLQWAIDQLDDVVEVHPMVRPKGNGVQVFLFVRTSPNIDVPMKDSEIKQAARSVLEEQFGLKVKKLTVNIDHSPIEEQ